MNKIINFKRQRVAWCVHIREDRAPRYDVDVVAEDQILVMIFSPSWDEVPDLRRRAEAELTIRS